MNNKHLLGLAVLALVPMVLFTGCRRTDLEEVYVQPPQQVIEEPVPEVIPVPVPITDPYAHYGTNHAVIIPGPYAGSHHGISSRKQYRTMGGFRSNGFSSKGFSSVPRPSYRTPSFSYRPSSSFGGFSSGRSFRSSGSSFSFRSGRR